MDSKRRKLLKAIGGTTAAAAATPYLSFPAIAHLNDGHYVVLHDLGPAGAVVGDPATGIVTWNLSLLAQCYTGSLVLFDWPTEASGGR